MNKEQKILVEKRVGYHLAGEINSMLSGDVEKRTFKDLVFLISNLVLADVEDKTTDEFKELKEVKEEIKEEVEKILRSEKYKQDIKFLVEEKDLVAEQLETQIATLKLRLLKHKMKKFITNPDVVFGEIELMKEIVQIWDKK